MFQVGWFGFRAQSRNACGVSHCQEDFAGTGTTFTYLSDAPTTCLDVWVPIIQGIL